MDGGVDYAVRQASDWLDDSKNMIEYIEKKVNLGESAVLQYISTIKMTMYAVSSVYIIN